MMAFFQSFFEPTLPRYLSEAPVQTSVIRKFLVILLLLAVTGLALEFIFDFRDFEQWFFVVALVATALFLVLSYTKVPRTYLITSYILGLLVLNQINMALHPKSFYVMMYWMGLTPLSLTFISNRPRILIWTVVIAVFLAINAWLLGQQVGSFLLVVSAGRFLAGGLFFLATTFSIALFFNFQQKKLWDALYQKNEQLESLRQAEHVRSARLEHYNVDLEARVANRTAALEKQNAQLAEYAFVNSHLVRGPLARIQGIANLISLSTVTTQQKELIEHLNKASVELDQVIYHINEVLEKDGRFDRGALEKLRQFKS